jgi:hypothetical protein
MGPTLGPPEHEKSCIDVSLPGCTKSLYVTKSPEHEKTQVGRNGPGVLFMGSASGPAKYEK